MQTSRLALLSAIGTSAMSLAPSTVQAEVDVWAILSSIQIDEIVTETSYEARKTFPEDMQNGMESVEVTGYAVPTLPGDTVQELMVVTDMGLCPFCGSGEHSGSLQVTLAEPIANFEDARRITLRGDLRAVTDPETWQAAILENARIVAQ